jgi:GT2 family glycosyltransferase
VDVAAVVVHHRAIDLLQPTLEHLARQSVRRVVVVDNGNESDAVADAIKLVHWLSQEVVQIEVPNEGYAAALNEGMRVVADADAFLLMSHETRLGDNSVEKLVREFEAPDVGVAAPLLCRLDDPQVVWSAGGSLDPESLRVFHHGGGEPASSWRTRLAQDVDWVDGAAWLVRADAAKQAGPLDERFFLYFEETSYCYRLRSLGWRVRCVPEAVAWQLPGNPDYALFARNRLRFLRMNLGRRAVARALGQQLRDVVADVRGHGKPSFETRQGVLGAWSFLRHPSRRTMRT